MHQRLATSRSSCSASQKSLPPRSVWRRLNTALAATVFLLRVEPHGHFSWLFLDSPHLLPFWLSIPLVLLPLTSGASCSAQLSLTRSAMSSSTISLRNSWAAGARECRGVSLPAPSSVRTSALGGLVEHLEVDLVGYRIVAAAQLDTFSRASLHLGEAEATLDHEIVPVGPRRSKRCRISSLIPRGKDSPATGPDALERSRLRVPQPA